MLVGLELVMQKIGPVYIRSVGWFVILGLALIVFWLVQFLDLMRRGESFFPAQCDKPIWAAASFIVFPIAPFAYWVWKSAR